MLYLKHSVLLAVAYLQLFLVSLRPIQVDPLLFNFLCCVHQHFFVIELQLGVAFCLCSSFLPINHFQTDVLKKLEVR
ncbi:hypothetical protein VNO77_32099 [Canavalia gladiata]|uniref:Uncharacterized protein n=1 Tax=Canavalia gladiata TaxID=3824 RepID=A0AAN9KRL5_CANGL